MDFTKLDELVQTVVERAGKEATPFSEVLDALGRVTAYYAMRCKVQGKADLPDDEPNFGDFQDALNGKEPEDGRKVRSRRRDA